MYDSKLSSRSVIHDSAGFAGRTMAEDLENPEDKVRDNTISVRRSKQFMRTVTAPARSPRRTSHRHRPTTCGCLFGFVYKRKPTPGPCNFEMIGFSVGHVGIHSS